MEQQLYWVDVHYACFGLLIASNRIVDAAPIARWMVGKTTQEVKPWLLAKKAIVKKV
jgi:hypothetical protein